MKDELRQNQLPTHAQLAKVDIKAVYQQRDNTEIAKCAFIDHIRRAAEVMIHIQSNALHHLSVYSYSHAGCSESERVQVWDNAAQEN